MREMLPILGDQVIVHEEKAIVWTFFPAEQVYVVATLIEADINAEVLHAGPTAQERSTFIQKSTRESKSCTVLVCNYSLNSAGLNSQHLCRNFRFFSAACRSLSMIG